VNRTLKMGAVLAGFGVVLSQMGHLLVYQLQFGSAALGVQSTGAHAYFPTLVKTSLGLGASAVLGSLLLIGVARFAAGARGRAIAHGPSYVSLLGGLFTVQLAFFALQETAESMAAGTAIATAPHLLLLGSVGQLPVAMLGALALRWLLVRFESAVIQIHVALAVVRQAAAPAAVVVFARWTHSDLIDTPVATLSLGKRGPPSSLRFSSN